MSKLTAKCSPYTRYPESKIGSPQNRKSEMTQYHIPIQQYHILTTCIQNTKKTSPAIESSKTSHLVLKTAITASTSTFHNSTNCTSTNQSSKKHAPYEHLSKNWHTVIMSANKPKIAHLQIVTFVESSYTIFWGLSLMPNVWTSCMVVNLGNLFQLFYLSDLQKLGQGSFELPQNEVVLVDLQQPQAQEPHGKHHQLRLDLVRKPSSYATATKN